MASLEKWTASQREHAEILFELYPDIEKTYSLTHSLRMMDPNRDEIDLLNETAENGTGTFTNYYTTKSGDKIVAFGYYGYE